MTFTQNLAELQVRAANHGWRIREIPWSESGKLEIIAPRSPLSKGLLGYGLGAFLAGLVVAAAFHVGVGLVMAASGLLSLLLTNLSMASNTYQHFKAEEARCVDSEIRYFEQHSRPLNSNGKTHDRRRSSQWVIRLLCEYGPPDYPVRVTPIIPVTFAFTSEAACKAYLNTHIKNGKCRLWVDPKNPLHTSFNEKPRFQMRGNC